MVDYDKSTGSGGVMRIRDNGTLVEFFIAAGSSGTFIHEMPWQYTINGSTSAWQEFDYTAGGGFRELGQWNVHSSQTVTFKLGATGTSGLGGPTTHSVFISRNSAPSTPLRPTISLITSTSMRVSMVDPANGGSAIDSREMATRGFNQLSGATNLGNIGSDKFIDITGLDPGVARYFWTRVHNAIGWSNWSLPQFAFTLDVPDAPSAPIMSEVSQVSAVATWTPNGDGGSPITGYDVGWGTDPSEPNTIEAVASAPMTIDSLSPGTNNYVWVRAKNSVGEGPWSVSTLVRTVAGVWVKVGPIWKEAVPYVKVDGVWRVARSWVRVAGVWRETL